MCLSYWSAVELRTLENANANGGPCSQPQFQCAQGHPALSKVAGSRRLLSALEVPNPSL
ncbi:hypothetical protein M0657_008011 [Pyricularia oryzae]|uniref:Uncharacterized protein n=3 Tax=Pyricularia oryzae TaxID=318829 RepID=A0A4P7NBG4_PYROR|nr:hypothetical protein OOU_Y34scaffold00511g22 [Pyricularia oryzae Y34]KAI7916478.1 hypothetical protein M9X92_007869 [Pyricularia oryzae]KAI7917568.1 hypothetical protein M0657_008011 [Pyricularia oryzae]QBZ59102.1 hypothetical protein PoMZ_04062 [Pyricularia oryzae]